MKIARRFGFMTKEEAKDAEQLLSKFNGADPTLDVLVEHGYLTPDQASTIEAERERSDPVAHIRELSKCSRRALRKGKSSLDRLNLAVDGSK